VLVAEDAFSALDPDAMPALAAARQSLLGHFATVETTRLSVSGLGDWVDVFRPLQGAEIWAGLGPWVTAHRPKLGPGIAERFAWVAGLDTSALGPLRQQRAEITARLDDLLGDDAVILLPTMPGLAPLCGSPSGVMETFRRQALGLLSPAGLAGLPQITMPLARLPAGPLGLSVLGPRGSDLALLALVSRLCAVHCAPR
jgi:amidase